MQRFVIVIAAIALIAMSASVDARGRGGGKGGSFGGQGNAAYGGVDRQAQFQKDLNLSQEQIAQMQEIRSNGGTRDEIHAVLNEEQRALVNERRGQGNGQGYGQRGASGKGRQGRGNATPPASDAGAGDG